MYSNGTTPRALCTLTAKEETSRTFEVFIERGNSVSYKDRFRVKLPLIDNNPEACFQPVPVEYSFVEVTIM